MASNPVVPTPELQLDTEKTQTETIFHCAGRITSSTASLLQSTVRRVIPEKKTVVLDLSNVTYMDSSGLGALVSLWVSAKKGRLRDKARRSKPARQGIASPDRLGQGVRGIKISRYAEFLAK